MPSKIMRRDKLLASLVVAAFVSSVIVYSKTKELTALIETPRSAPVSFSSATTNLYIIERNGAYTIRARGANLPEITAQLAKASGIDIELDPRLADEKIDLDLNNATLEDILKQLSAGYTHTFQKDGEDYALVSATIISKEEPLETAQLPKRTTPAPQLPNGVLTNVEDIKQSMNKPGRPLIMLQNALIDVEAARAGKHLEVPSSLRASPDTEYHIIQFAEAVSEQHRTLLEEAGAVIIHYVPNAA